VREDIGIDLDRLREQAQRSLAAHWLIEGTDPFGEMCRYALLPGGKLFRPLLLIDSCLLVRPQSEPVLPAAAGIEYAHVASLVHDDIIDGDSTRRGRDAVHARYGRDHALLVGDALIFQTFGALAACRHQGAAAEAVVRAVELYAAAGVDMCRGEALEARVSGALSCPADRYLEVARLKTAALFRCATECGAVLGGGTPEQVRALRQYGERLGVLFQIADDLLPYLSRPERTGKPATSDFRNRRVTLPLLHAYAEGGEQVRARIERAFTLNHDDPGELAAHQDGLEAIRATGAVEAAQRTAAEQGQAALDLLAGFPESESRRRLTMCVRWGLERQE
jgi:geranylgeranyl diphosphate synthase type I